MRTVFQPSFSYIRMGLGKFNADEFENMVAERRLFPDGCGVKYISNHGLLDKWWALHS